jgi:hypothetical protein
MYALGVDSAKFGGQTRVLAARENVVERRLEQGRARAARAANLKRAWYDDGAHAVDYTVALPPAPRSPAYEQYAHSPGLPASDQGMHTGQNAYTTILAVCALVALLPGRKYERLPGPQGSFALPHV